MLYGCMPGLPGILLPIPLLNEPLQYPEKYLDTLTKRLIWIQTLAFENTIKSTMQQFKHTQIHCHAIDTFKEGQHVLFYCSWNASRVNKLDLKWTGPYEIIIAHQNDNYTIKHCTTSTIINRVHAKFLKLPATPAFI